MIKVEAVVIRERVETVIDAVEEATGHVGVTVVEASATARSAASRTSTAGGSSSRASCPRRSSPSSSRTARRAVVAAIVDAARSGNESGDGLVWTTPVDNVIHNRTGAGSRRWRSDDRPASC